jgi:hypothetical protein
MAIFNSQSVQALPLDDPDNAFTPGTRIEGWFTVDNCFQVWLGTSDAVNTQLYKTVINRSDVTTGYEIKFNYAPGDYLYIIAWSDNKIWQGLIGQFAAVGSATKVYTDDPAWWVYPTGMDFGLEGGPTEADINGFLSVDPLGSVGGPSKWQKPVTGQANVNPPLGKPFTFVANNIDPAARWIWHNSHRDQRGDYPNSPWVPFTCPLAGRPDYKENLNDEFLIFAIPQDEIITKSQQIPSPLPPGVFTEQLFADNKFALTLAEQAMLWSTGDAETDLDFLVAWMVDKAAEIRFDPTVVGMGVGVRVANGPKTSLTQDVLVAATDQEDNSTPNSVATDNAGIRYTDGRIFPGLEVDFVVEGFVSPLRATLKEEFESTNRAISLAELQTYDVKLPKDSTGRTEYNALLSALRAMGQFEAMVDRIIKHVGELNPSPDIATAAKISTLISNLENLKLKAVAKIYISDTWWDISVSYASYRRIKDNQPFP